jgi:hypothetical protein
MDDMANLKARKNLTLLTDGWEDRLRRSIYGTVASQVGEEPIVMSLNDITGKRGSADVILANAKKALSVMQVDDGKNFIALCTDNPTTMQSFRRKYEKEFPWVIVRRYLLIQPFTPD